MLKNVFFSASFFRLSYTIKFVSLLRHGNKSQTKSFQYVVNRCFGKMLNVRSKEDVDVCMQMFNCTAVNLTVAKREVKFP